ncbi:MAG: DUF2889 domain-containing protein [Sphingomonadales bacterium]|nr:DUF2889 domain-containing protein [Sphingomonadales bacterium]
MVSNRGKNDSGRLPITTTSPSAPRLTANPSPVRRAGSVRRTASIDVAWPDGAEGDRLLHGRVRDMLTPAEGEARVLDQATMEVVLRPDKTIAAISAVPAPANLHDLVGQRGGNHLRLMIRDTMPELIDTAAPLYLVLDDISGTSLVSSWAWAQWTPDWMARVRELMPPDQLEKMTNARLGVCWGLQPGNSGTQQLGSGSHTVNAADAGELRNPEDPDGWHLFPEIAGPSFRRARRIDLWRDETAGLIRVEASFQDSAPAPGGKRVAIHEYVLRLAADAQTLAIRSIEPEPRILPFHECPGAVANAQRMVGVPLPAIRDAVLDQLRGPAGCTHLNDAMRALADVPRLLERL